MNDLPSRRSFIHSVGLGFTALGLTGTTLGQEKPIQGFDDTAAEADRSREWKPVSDRKIRVGIVGYGACRFGAAFSFQEHPNVTVAAVSDLFEDRRAALARACRCEKTYPSLEQRRCSWPPTPQATPGTASTSSSTANTSLAPCLPLSVPWKTPTNCLKPSKPAASII